MKNLIKLIIYLKFVKLHILKLIILIG